jgi:molybdopterin-guanine dinucleotide biosynthesis protein B
MKVFSLVGYSKSGKTTTIENIIRELVKRNYTVGTIKQIHLHNFKMDATGTNTDRHKNAGASLVTARGEYETNILYQDKLSINEILDFYTQDYVILEGIRDFPAPKIVTAFDEESIEARIDDTTFAISGQVANNINQYKNLPVLNSMNNVEKLVDLIEEKVFERLPDMKDECCKHCGHTCKELCSLILKGECERRECVLDDQKVILKVNGKEIKMVPFVQKILQNSVEAVAKELDGYTENGEIEIIIKK